MHAVKHILLVEDGSAKLQAHFFCCRRTTARPQLVQNRKGQACIAHLSCYVQNVNLSGKWSIWKERYHGWELYVVYVYSQNE